MDNKPLEEESENYLKNRLSKNDIDFAKPSFDKGGIDLLALKKQDDYFYKALNLQSKGRTVHTNGSSVKINDEYVTSEFVCFLYVKIPGNSNDFFYAFFYEDIIKWSHKNNHYQLNIPKDFHSNSTFMSANFDDLCITKFKSLLNKSTPIKQKFVFEKNFLPIDISFELWRYSKGLPDAKTTQWFFDNLDFNTTLFKHDLFLLHLAVKYAEELQSGMADSFFLEVKLQCNTSNKITDIPGLLTTIEDKDYYQEPWLIAYPKVLTKTVKYLSQGSELHGLYTYLGDSKEFIEVLLLEDESKFLYYGINKQS